ncbi:L-threonylcarbamoyladenylate synthase [Deinococcus koreensis]|uniref:L-threonylcarbamoyladenylate synthase n=1 Tax=Deinococcus koreensis TaxID=2054903 RepID=A0A2K3V125_9DEIO|nr:L-threonylcarbamoyladenylate synthase [Deinococcus koreensis]PNY82488.1 translation factor Sua5 [Deinococcus koreensis]
MNPPPVPPTPAPEWHAAVSAALDALHRGGVVAYPTETVWGLAAHPAFPEAVQRLRSEKGSAADKPLQVSCDSARQALLLARPDGSLERLSGLWPGPLTVVTPGSALCPPALMPQGKVGLRVPDHPVALELLRRSGGFLVTTSCNRTGEPPALTEQEARATDLADLTLPDGGVPAGGQASTVVLLPGGLILRRGILGEAQIRAALRGTALPPTGERP